jgi:hypothetical protein
MFQKEQLTQSGRSVTLLGPFHEHFGRMHGYFVQDCPKAHTATYPINVLKEVFETD